MKGEFIVGKVAKLRILETGRYSSYFNYYVCEDDLKYINEDLSLYQAVDDRPFEPLTLEDIVYTVQNGIGPEKYNYQVNYILPNGDVIPRTEDMATIIYDRLKDLTYGDVDCDTEFDVDEVSFNLLNSDEWLKEN